MKKQLPIFSAALLLGILGFISFNIYLPAIPTIIKNFHTTNAMVKYSLTFFLVGFSLSQFFWGSLSSKHGRKKAILCGLILSEIGTIFAIFAPNIYVFNSARILEGIGVGSASVLARALIADTMDQAQIAKAMSYISSASNIMPALAPIVGSLLILFFSWRSVFIVLFIYTSILLYLFYKFLKETNQYIQPDLTVTHAASEYKIVFTNRKFVGYILPYLALSGMMIGYYAATPFIFIIQLHLSAQHYSLLSVLTVISYIVGANSSIPLQKKLGMDNIILSGIIISLFAGLIFFIYSIFLHLSVITVIVPMMIYTLATGLIAPCTNACALDELRHIAGAAAAVIGASVYAFGAAGTAFITSLDLSKLSSLGIYTITASAISLITFVALIIRHRE